MDRKSCTNPACFYSTSLGSMYCCGGCALADEHHYDPDGYHTDGCKKLRWVNDGTIWAWNA